MVRQIIGSMSLFSKTTNLDNLLREASDPTTAPERLRELYTAWASDQVYKALSGNANTPPDVLLQLAAPLCARRCRWIALPRWLRRVNFFL